MSDLLIQAMNAKEKGETKLAQQLLSQVIIQNPRNEAAWMLMAEVVNDVKLRRNCLERVLLINPDSEAASQALAKLNTSPLGPAIQGERNKPPDTPVDPTKAEKTPPFTPPFTWDGKPEQYLALGDMTFPEESEEEANPLGAEAPTFDWVNESNEPGKTIDKIFEAVSNPELASEPPQQKEGSWLDELRPGDEIIEPQPEFKQAEFKKQAPRRTEPRKSEDPWLDELVGSEESAAPAEQPLTEDDFSVSAEPQLGLQAFTTTEQPVPASSEQDSLLWDNPHAKADRLVILSYRSLIYATPPEDQIPTIMELFNQNRMVRDVLGTDAHMIKLESIERVTTNPKSANLVIEYKPNDKVISHELHFASPQVRDEVLSSLKFRLGASFIESSHTISLEDKILSPIFLIILVAVIAWALIGGVPLLSKARGFESGPSQAVLANVQQVINQIGAFYIILAAGVIGLLCIIWMALNLRKPSSQIVLKR